MKTAMQELHNKWSNEKEWSWEKIEIWFKEALEKEKDAIIIAWNDSKISIMNGEQYFEETYNQKNL
jgi:hypothetical protein